MNRTLELIRSRSIRFQLTSLMDLLLIIVFAQYLEFHRSTDASKIQTEQEIAVTRDSLEKGFQEQSDELSRLREQIILENRQLRKQRDEALAQVDQTKRQQAFTEALVQELLQVDPELIDRDLSPATAAETIQAAQQLAESIRVADSTQVLRFLAGYDELLKRAEVWTLHVSDRGDTEMQPGQATSNAQQFRLEAATQMARADEFVAQMRAAYLQIPQPKGLVVILVSFSPRATAGNYQPVLDAMPDVIEWLNNDSGGRTRFEYAVIGAITDPGRDLPIVSGEDAPPQGTAPNQNPAPDQIEEK
ncbi:MAG: hypothetical protein VYA84_13225 [Planctomycetota bacterium]|nr:hypothetical protein [Planctomycetota bacterium]